jgi:hypothetical protein
LFEKIEQQALEIFIKAKNSEMIMNNERAAREEYTAVRNSLHRLTERMGF